MHPPDILIDLERRPIQTFPVHPAYAEREESECGDQGYYGRPLSTRLASWAETSPRTVNGGSAECFNTGHDNSDVIFFTISVKRGKEGRTITTTIIIVMSTYPMEIPLFLLQPATIGLLLSDDKGDGIWGKLSWGGMYRIEAFL